MEITKYCNIYSISAEAEKLELPFVLYKHDINSNLDSYRKKNGGLWVGGKFTIDDNEFRFSTNTINKVIHKTDEEFSFPLKSVKRIWRDFGWLTGILNFELEDTVVRVRCFGAKTIADKINKEI